MGEVQRLEESKGRQGSIFVWRGRTEPTLITASWGLNEVEPKVRLWSSQHRLNGLPLNGLWALRVLRKPSDYQFYSRMFSDFFFFWHWCPKFWKDKCIKNLNTGKAITQWHLITLMQWDYRISTVMQSSTPVPFQWLENSWPINVRILLQLGWGRPEGSRCKTRRLFLYRWIPPPSPPFSRMTPKRRHWVLLCLLPGRCRSITSQPLALNGHVEFWFSGVWIYLNAGV